jgi:hypothetical protein
VREQFWLKLLQFALSPPFARVAIGGGFWLQLGPSLLRVVSSLDKTTNSKARRAQRLRQSDRALSTLAKANLRLQRHHGSSSDMARRNARTLATDSPARSAPRRSDAPKVDWTCKACVNRDGAPWRNSGSLSACGKCKVAKGASFGAKAEASACPTVSTREGGHRSAAELLKQEQKHSAELRKELEAIRAARNAESSAAQASAPTAEAAMLVDADGGSTVLLDEAVNVARNQQKELLALSTYQRSLLPDFGGTAAVAQATLDAALAARRAANPLRKQLETAETHQKTSRKQLAEAESVLVAKQEQMQLLQQEIVAQNEAITKATAKAAKADAEVAALAAAFAAERNVAAPPGAPTSAAAADTLQPGFVSCAFANEQWQVREAQFTAQLAELRALVSGPPNDAQSERAPSEVEPSEAGDGLDDDLDDDAAWGKVEKGKRRGVLRRQRDRLAKDVRISLGKVSSAASPFTKK